MFGSEEAETLLDFYMTFWIHSSVPTQCVEISIDLNNNFWKATVNKNKLEII